jgi:hypothetical protein
LPCSIKLESIMRCRIDPALSQIKPSPKASCPEGQYSGLAITRYIATREGEVASDPPDQTRCRKGSRPCRQSLGFCAQSTKQDGPSREGAGAMLTASERAALAEPDNGEWFGVALGTKRRCTNTTLLLTRAAQRPASSQINSPSPLRRDWGYGVTAGDGGGWGDRHASHQLRHRTGYSQSGGNISQR